MARTDQQPRIIVLGDLTLDVVLAPARPLERGTDVPGRALLRQGGSAANTARGLGRLGVRTTLVCAVGRDHAGRALVAAVRSDGVRVRVIRVARERTGRIGVLVEPGGERSFVADRGAADRLAPEDLDAGWFAGIDALHLPAYSLLGHPLGDAGLAATRLAHAAGGLVTVDLASVGPLLERGRRAAAALLRDAAPDLVFATAGEALAVAGTRPEALLDLAPIAVVKRGAQGATVLARDPVTSRGPVLRLEVATTPITSADTTGAGDAFDAGFLAAWLAARRRRLAQPAALRRGAVAGNRAALRHLSSPPGELALG
jgi:sugar/nucleoside kinase (ribokinase family)